MARPIDPTKRPAIIDAARRIFLDKGYSATRMSEIAAQAGVAVGTLYLYFDSKEAIARAMAERFYQRLAASALPLLEPALLGTSIDPALTGGITLTGHSPQERIRQLVHVVLTTAVEERDALQLAPTHLFNTAPTPGSALSVATTHEPYAECFKQLGATLASLMAAGRLHRYEDSTVLAELVLTCSLPVIYTYISLDDNERERYEAVYVELLEHALIPPHVATERDVALTATPHADAVRADSAIAGARTTHTMSA